MSAGKPYAMRVSGRSGVRSAGVGTGAGEGATGQDTGTAWATRSADCPEAPAQAHPLADETVCIACGHQHTLDGCAGPPTASDRWAGVTPAACDCDYCEHHWLDRPESDTRECLICGTEVSG